MFCQNCGAQMNAGDRTCKRCGAPVRQAANQYQNYAQPAEGYHREEHVSTGGWIGINFLMLIPIVNIILLIVWAFGGSRQRSLQTWARAKLILLLISILITVAVIVILIVTGVNVSDIMRNGRYY